MTAGSYDQQDIASESILRGRRLLTNSFIVTPYSCIAFFHTTFGMSRYAIIIVYKKRHTGYSEASVMT